MRSVLVIVSALIVYGSLYPFDFRWPQDYAAEAMTIASLFHPFATSRGDLLGNIVLFLPYGFAGIFVLDHFGGRIAQLMIVILSGALFALLLQVGQYFVPERDPSLVDVFWNVVGVVLAATIAVTPLGRRLVSIGGSIALNVPSVLAGIWVASELMPLIPSLDFQLVKQNLKTLLLTPEFRAQQALLYFAAWLAALHFLSSSTLSRNYRVLLPALPFAVLAVQPFIVRHELNLSEVLGTVVGVTVWFAARTRLRSGLLAGLLLIGILAANLYPLDFHFPRNVFSWVPFRDFLEGDMVLNAAALVQKVFLYGALIWLLTEAGMGWMISTAFVFASLTVQEALQVYVAGATAGVTDPILAALTALAMHAAARTSQFRGERSPKPMAVSAARNAMGRSEVRAGHADRAATVWHLGSLDGLRGLAALAVFCVHFNQAANLGGSFGPFDLNRFLTNGNTGVALFFVLSGFLLSIPFWRSQQERGKPVDVKAYAVRRLARILPAYYFCLLLLVSAKGVFGNWPSINDLLSHFLFLHNLKDDNILNINPPFWTLAVEMQFYVLLPFLFLTLRRLSPIVSFAIVLSLSVGTYVANFELVSYLLARNHWPINVALIWPFALELSGPGSFVLTYSTFAHLTFFLAGIGAAWLFLRSGGSNPDRMPRQPWVRDAVFWGAALMIVVILSTPLDDTLQLPFGHYNWPVIPLLLAAMVFAAPHARTAIAIFDQGAVRWLGLISYGVYIYHYPILKVMERAMAMAGLGVTAHWLLFGGASFAATIVVASLSYALLEKPIMQAARGRWSVQTVTALVNPVEPIQLPRPLEGSQAKTTGWAEVPIGLGSEQVSHLRRISGGSGRSVSSATRHAIAEFITRLSHEPSNDTKPLANGLSGQRDRSPGAPAGSESREHQYVVNLPDDYVEFLGVLSAKLGTTMSRTVQMIVDDFITQRAGREKTGP